MKRTSWILGTVAIAFLIVAAAGRSKNFSAAVAEEKPAATAIKIDNFTFSPVTVTVPLGSTVRWTNHDDIPHTVVSDDKTSFKSKALDTDDSFSYTFTKPGTYLYFCSIHPKMTAKVIVVQ